MSFKVIQFLSIDIICNDIWRMPHRKVVNSSWLMFPKRVRRAFNLSNISSQIAPLRRQAAEIKWSCRAITVDKVLAMRDKTWSTVLKDTFRWCIYDDEHSSKINRSRVFEYDVNNYNSLDKRTTALNLSFSDKLVLFLPWTLLESSFFFFLRLDYGLHFKTSSVKFCEVFPGFWMHFHWLSKKFKKVYFRSF